MNKRLGGRFVLEREIGSGGMASVYLGVDEVLERQVAVKVLKAELQDSDIGARFRREGRTAARLSHSQVVQVYDAGEDDLEGQRVSYIVMEHVSGGDLREKIAERGVLSTEEISGLSGIAGGLAHAHVRGVVHRDVKPHNILMDAAGQPKLTDFGIARALDAAQFTHTGMYLGTARYSSPEQLQGKETTDKSDVYSFGITLYEAVTGNPPFSGTPIEIATQHVHKTPVPPGEQAPTDPGLEALILDCLAKNPDDRPTASETETRLRNLTGGTGATRQHVAAGAASPVGSGETPGGTENTTSPGPAGATGAYGSEASRRVSRRVPVVAGALLVLALLGIIGAYALLGEADRPDRSAQTPAATTQETVPQTTNRDTNRNTDRNTESGAAAESASATSPATTPVSSPEPDAQQDSSPSPEPQQDTEAEQVAEVTRDVYRFAASGAYGQSYDLLSQSFKQNQAPTQAQWSGQFDTLEQISFLEGPNVEISGDTAQVTGVTRAVHSDRVEENTATWSLIREGNGWKLDGADVNIDVVG